MHKITNACGINYQCLFLPDTDTLVRKEYLVNNNVQSPVIYKNVSTRLTRFYDPITLSHQYSFDASNPDFVFREAGGYAWPIGGFGSSQNGKWVAMEFLGRGMGLLNVETNQMRRFTMRGWTYSVGANPVSEFAVSNDGLHVAQMGLNAGIEIYDVLPGCGDEATDYQMRYAPQMPILCKNASILYDYITYFKTAYLPKFSDDGGQLDFFATSKQSGPRQVSLRASGYSGRKLDYLALGDSYSSGEGEIDDNYYVNGSNDEHEKCHTSNRSYPFVVSNLLGFNLENVESVACSGAKTIDVIGSDSTYWGQGDRLGVKYLNLDDLQRQAVQSEALAQFIPGRARQNSFVGLYQPSVITIGIGGNDAGFMSKLTGCLGPGTCNFAGTAEGKEQTAVEIKGLFNTLVNTYTEIHKASLNSKIYAIGYPRIISKVGTCGAYVNFLFDSTERDFINTSILYLNQVVESAARAVGIGYVDIYDSFGEHTLCGSEAPSAINLVMLGDDLGPFNNLKWFRLIGSESFHPNPLGHEFTGQMIVNKVGNILTSNNCANQAIICPDGSTAPEPPVELLPDGYHDLPDIKNISFVYDKLDPNQIYDKSIIMPDYSFAPNSDVNLVFGSNQKLSWDLMASGTGSVDASIQLPDSVPEGIYLIYINGSSYSGDDISFYAFAHFYVMGQPFDYPDPDIDDPLPPTEDPDTDDDDDPVVIGIEIKNDTTVPPVQPPTVYNYYFDHPDNEVMFASEDPQVKGASIIASKLTKKPKLVKCANNNWGFWLLLIICLLISIYLFGKYFHDRHFKKR